MQLGELFSIAGTNGKSLLAADKNFDISDTNLKNQRITLKCIDTSEAFTALKEIGLVSRTKVVQPTDHYIR